MSDPEERNYLLELLEEQNERSESIIKAEDQRLSKELELLNVKCQITEDLYNLKVSFLESLVITINLTIIIFSAILVGENIFVPACETKKLDQK